MSEKHIVEIIKLLKSYYPNAKCSLNFNTPFELVVAVMLSAQCTDERVNLTTPILFKTFPSIQSFAISDINILEEIIHPCGFFKNKSKNVKACAQKILSDFKGTVPNTMEELLTLPGIGRKSANVILLEVFNIANGIAIDTHAKRISNKLGLSNNSDPLKIELDLLKIIPKPYLKDVNHLLVYHGRKICTSRNPKCNSCPIKIYCKYYLKHISK